MALDTAATTTTPPAALATTLGWELYPEGVDEYNVFACDASQVRSRLLEQAKLTFSDEHVAVNFIDASATSEFKAKHFDRDSADAVVRHLESCIPDLRLISILRKDSLSRLRISRELLLKILKYHSIAPRFLDLLPAFRKLDDLSHKANPRCSILRVSNSQIEVCYSFKYMEMNDHTPKEPWSERQIGVYHRFGGDRDVVKAVMVLLHANATAKALQRLQQVFEHGKYHESTPTSPLALHVLIFSSYIDNWQPFLRWIMSQRGLENKENEFVVIQLKDPSLSFTELQSMRDLESRLMGASAMLQAFLETIEGIEACGISLMEADLAVKVASAEAGITTEYPELQQLRALKQKGRGYLQSVDLIQRRVGVVIGLMSDGLNQPSATTANKIAGFSYILTQRNLNDSYIVKIIALITVVYLPMQGVASFFGMNLTEFSPDSSKMVLAKNMWLFLATALPLTVITLSGLWVAWRLEKKRKRDQEQHLFSSA